MNKNGEKPVEYFLALILNFKFEIPRELLGFNILC